TPYESGTFASNFVCVLSGQLAEAKGGVHHGLAVQTFPFIGSGTAAALVGKFPKPLGSSHRFFHFDEPLQVPNARRVPHLSERFRFDLANPFPRDFELLA